MELDLDTVERVNDFHVVQPKEIEYYNSVLLSNLIDGDIRHIPSDIFDNEYISCYCGEGIDYINDYGKKRYYGVVCYIINDIGETRVTRFKVYNDQ